MNSKVCNKCKLLKELDCFWKQKIGKYGHQAVCKDCKKDDNKKRSKESYEKNKEQRKQYATDKRKKVAQLVENNEIDLPSLTSKKCSKCNITKSVLMFSFRKSRNQYESSCKDCRKIEAKLYRENNSEKISKSRSSKPLSLQNRLRNSQRKRIWTALTSQGQIKTDSTVDLIGCSISFLKEWLLFNFEKDSKLQISNYGKEWHIDHAVPCSLFDFRNKSQQKICFHWTNLRPEIPSKNISKSNNIAYPLLLIHEYRLRQFVKTRNIPEDVFSIWKNGALTTASNAKVFD